MPKRKIDTELLKSHGVLDTKQNEHSVEFYLDPNKINSSVKKSIAALGDMKSLDKGNASNVYSSPMIPSFYEGPGKAANMPPHEKMKLAIMYFHSDPMAGKIIELMTTFANDGFKNECRNKKTKKWFDEWNDKAQMEVVRNWIFLEYFRSGNVTTYREFVKYSPELFKSKAAFEEAFAAKKKDWTKSQIPIAYTVINPLYVKVKNGENNAWKDTLYGNDNISVDSSSKEDMNSLEVSSNITQRVKDILRSNVSDKPLSEKQYQRILRMRQPYEAYGTIMMERAFNALYEKNKMRQMDLDTLNSSISQLIKVTVGDKDYPATPRQVKAITNAFQNVGKSQMIFWNHTLQVEAIKMENHIIDEKKYERVDSDIRNAFGISEVLLGGGGSKVNFATSYLQLKAFITNLIDARKAIARWYDSQYQEIAKVVGFDEVPTVVFNPLSLTDEIAEKQLIMQLVDRGIISYETAQIQLGFDPDIEEERRTNEQPLIKEGIYGPIGSPYTQAAADGIVLSAEQSGKNVKKEDKKTPDNSDQKENQKNRASNKTGDPSKNVVIKGGPKLGDEGRPKGQGPGKKMPNRKSPGRSGASLTDPTTEFAQREYTKELTDEINDILEKESINQKAIKIIKESR